MSLTKTAGSHMQLGDEFGTKEGTRAETSLEDKKHKQFFPELLM